jgi:Iap family predicted aminopeptidase
MKLLDNVFNTTDMTPEQQVAFAAQRADEDRRAGLLIDAHHDEWVASALRDMLGLPQADEAYGRGYYKRSDFWDGVEA